MDLLPDCLRPTLILKVGLAVLAGLLAGCSSAGGDTAIPATAAHSVSLKLDLSTEAGPVRSGLLGSNVPWYHEAEGMIDAKAHLRPALLSLARQMGPAVLRYPGAPDTHHWRQGVGPLAERPVTNSGDGRPDEKILLGTQEFLELCDELGAEPLIELNLHEGSDESLAAEAADWLRYTNRQTLRSSRTGRVLPRVRLWELGNEPYLMEATLGPAGSAQSGPNPLFLTPTQYVRRLNKVIAAMRAVDPDIRLGLPFATDTLSGRPWSADAGERAMVVGPQLGYARTLLDGLEQPERIGFLALHYYMPLLNDPTDAQGRRLALPDDMTLYWGAMAGAETVRQHLAQVRSLWRGHPRTQGLAQPSLIVTEFNAFFTHRSEGGIEAPSNAYVATQAGAMFVADLVHMLVGEPDVEKVLQWSLSRNWHFGALSFNDAGNEFYGRPAFHVLSSLRQQLGEPGTVLRPIEVQVGTTHEADRAIGFAGPVAALPLAKALATQTGKTVRVLVINKDPVRPAQVSLDFGAGQSAPARAAHVELRSSGGNGPLGAAGLPGATRSETVDLSVLVDANGRPSPLEWKMPAASLAWLTVQLP